MYVLTFFCVHIQSFSIFIFDLSGCEYEFSLPNHIPDTEVVSHIYNPYPKHPFGKPTDAVPFFDVFK